MLHKHHIIPRHAGGSDDPSNLIELTVEEHAEAHKKLYNEHGRWQDKMAWQLLSGQVKQKDAMALLCKLRMTDEVKRKISMTKRGSKLSEEHKRKISLGGMGKKQPQSQKDKVSAKLSMDWLITDKNGKTFVVHKLSKWCKENNVDPNNLRKYGHSKGFKCQRIYL